MKIVVCRIKESNELSDYTIMYDSLTGDIDEYLKEWDSCLGILDEHDVWVVELDEITYKRMKNDVSFFKDNIEDYIESEG